MQNLTYLTLPGSKPCGAEIWHILKIHAYIFQVVYIDASGNDGVSPLMPAIQPVETATQPYSQASQLWPVDFTLKRPDSGLF